MIGFIGVQMKKIDYIMCCVLCNGQESLRMLAHRGSTDQVCGWLFVCEKCQSQIQGKYIKIELLESCEDSCKGT